MCLSLCANVIFILYHLCVHVQNKWIHSIRLLIHALHVQVNKMKVVADIWSEPTWGWESSRTHTDRRRPSEAVKGSLLTFAVLGSFLTPDRNTTDSLRSCNTDLAVDHDCPLTVLLSLTSDFKGEMEMEVHMQTCVCRQASACTTTVSMKDFAIFVRRWEDQLLTRTHSFTLSWCVFACWGRDTLQQDFAWRF